MSRLFDAVETGVMPPDDLLQKRVTQLRTARDALQVELAKVKETATLTGSYRKPTHPIVETKKWALRMKYPFPC